MSDPGFWRSSGTRASVSPSMIERESRPFFAWLFACYRYPTHTIHPTASQRKFPLPGSNPREYIYFAGRRVAWWEASEGVYYYLQDVLGSTRVITDSR